METNVSQPGDGAGNVHVFMLLWYLKYVGPVTELIFEN
jgi:hypothetical protein